MMDDYLHLTPSVFYITDNIPGPTRNSSENKTIIDNFNSQLTTHCNCQEKCFLETCPCIVNSGSYNYYERDSILTLSTDKLHTGTTFPILECNNNCQCNNKCGNRVVQNGPLQGLFIKDFNQYKAELNTSKGLGLFTTNVIPEGTFICTYAGEVITRSEALVRYEQNSSLGAMNYIFCLREHSNGKITETIVDPSKFGNIGRYINHSCEPNSVIVPVRIDMPVPKLAIFSCKNIAEGSEITFDYGPHRLSSSDIIIENNTRKKCLCDSKSCRQWLPYDVY